MPGCGVNEADGSVAVVFPGVRNGVARVASVGVGVGFAPVGSGTNTGVASVAGAPLPGVGEVMPGTAGLESPPGKAIELKATGVPRSLSASSIRLNSTPGNFAWRKSAE